LVGDLSQTFFCQFFWLGLTAVGLTGAMEGVPSRLRLYNYLAIIFIVISLVVNVIYVIIILQTIDIVLEVYFGILGTAHVANIIIIFLSWHAVKELSITPEISASIPEGYTPV